MFSLRLCSTFYTVISFFLTVISIQVLLPILKKTAGQPIYLEGPSWHQSKCGTPTLGGIGIYLPFFVLLSVSLLFLNFYENSNDLLELLLLFAYASLHACLGFLDDQIKLKSKKNAGLSPLQKIVFQCLFAFLFLFLRVILLHDTQEITFFNISISLGGFYYPVMMFLLVGIVNCANLTDGIDGLAAGVAFAIGISLLFFSFGVNLSVFLSASVLIGSMAGFLVFNSHPAKIFMGDTGSLFLGALIVGSIVSMQKNIVLFPLCGVYILEGVSVVLQVICYKTTKKRIFLMAPLHHHLEKKGWSENRICLTALFISLLLSVPAFFLLTSHAS